MRLSRTRLGAGIGALAAATALTGTLIVQNQSGQQTDIASGSAAGGAAEGVETVSNSKPAPAPQFLAPEELPPNEHSAWYTGDPAAGLPADPLFCFEGVDLPADGAWHQSYWTELDATAGQVVLHATDEAAAEELVGELKAAAADCAADWLRGEPGAVAGWDDLGPVRAGDEAHLFAVYTAPPQAGTGITGLGIGRVDATVTLVNWSQMGSLEDVPAADLAETMGHALNHLAS